MLDVSKLWYISTVCRHMSVLTCHSIYYVILIDDSIHKLESLDPQKREQLEARFLGRVSTACSVMYMGVV